MMALSELVVENLGTVLLLIVTLVVILLYQNARRPSGFPPGPPALPIIGNVLAFRSPKPVYETFLELAEKYGRIFSLKLGSFWVIVLNDTDDIREAFVKQLADFAGRSDFYTTRIFSGGYQDIAFSDYSPEWQLHRKIGQAALRHFAQGEKLETLIHGVLPGIANVLEQSAGKPIDLRDVLERSNYLVLANMCYGKNHDLDDPILTKWFENDNKTRELLGGGLPRDFIHSLKYLPPLPREKQMRELLSEGLQFVYDEFKGHRETFDRDNIRDIFDSLIAAQMDESVEDGSVAEFLTDTRVIYTVADLFGAGTGTTTPTLYWAIAAMVEYPHIHERVAKEIDEVIGPDRLPQLSDRVSMPYTEATLMEVHRYGVVAPVGMPKSATRTTTLRGYKIPKNTMIVGNVWAAHHDPAFWDEPFKFKPERFMDESETHLIKPPPAFMPFGLGRRSCMGENFAKGQIFLLFCWLFGRYSLSKVPGREKQFLLQLKQPKGFDHEPCPFEVVVKK